MDIKAIIADLIEKITKDSSLKEKFEKDPVETVKGLAGNLPADKIGEVVEGVTAKLGASSLGDKLGGIGDKIGGLFGKK